MKFSRTLAAVGLAIVGAANAMTVNTVAITIEGIHGIAETTNHLTAFLGGISLSNCATEGPNVAVELTGITTYINQLVQSVRIEEAPFEAADAANVFEAYTSYASSTHTLLEILAGDHALFTRFNLADPIAAALRLLGEASDRFGLVILTRVPTCESDFNKSLAAVRSDMETVLDAYGQAS